MEITTSKGKTYKADYGGIGYRGMFKTQIHDPRPLIDVIPEMSRCSSLTFCNDEGIEKEYTGYSVLWRADTLEPGVYIFILAKEVVADE